MSRFLDALPTMVVDSQVQRLAQAFPGRHPDLAGFTATVRDALTGWRPAELESAVSAAILHERSFPRIAALVKHRPERAMSAEGYVSSGRCGQCGVEPYEGMYTRRDGTSFVRIRCDCDRGPQWSQIGEARMTPADIEEVANGAPLQDAEHQEPTDVQD